MKWFVYVIGMRKPNGAWMKYFKIGYASNGADARIQEMQTSNPFKLEKLAEFDFPNQAYARRVEGAALRRSRDINVSRCDKGKTEWRYFEEYETLSKLLNWIASCQTTELDILCQTTKLDKRFRENPCWDRLEDPAEDYIDYGMD